MDSFFNKLLAAVILIISLPIIVVAILIIKMEDGGDILFRQSRIGKHGKPFQMYKLRSMQMGAEKMPVPVDNCEKTSVEMKVKADYRVTGVGRWLRRFSLDELAQLINVFKGDMVIVGPRPHLPSEIERYSGVDSQRLEVFPGITGLWQVSGRSDKNFREQVDLDLNYVANRSVWLDVKIIFKTIPAILLGRGAY